MQPEELLRAFSVSSPLDGRMFSSGFFQIGKGPNQPGRALYFLCNFLSGEDVPGRKEQKALTPVLELNSSFSLLFFLLKLKLQSSLMLIQMSS